MIDSLRDVPPDKGFWFCNGTRALNIYNLVDVIEHTGEDVFRTHVIGARNDFAAWILDVLEDEVLFHLIKDERDKYWFVQKIRHRIKDLEEQGVEVALRKR